MSPMSYTIERPSLFERTIQGVVSAADADKRLRAVVQKLSREVVIRGFRPGKVPPAEIEKRFWENISADVQSELINDVMTEVEKEEKMTILLDPELDSQPLVKGQDFAFTLHLWIRPRIEVAGLDDLSVKLDPIVVTDEDVETTVRKTREQHAEKEDVDLPVDVGLLAEVDATVKQGDQDYLGPVEHFVVEVGQDLIAKGFDEKIVGMKTGEIRDFKLSVEHGEHTHELDCHVTVHKVQRRILPAIDAAFLEKVGFDTEDEFRADVREKMAGEAETLRRSTLKQELLQKIQDQNPLDVPEPILLRHVELALDRFRREMQMYGQPAADVDAQAAGLNDRFREEAGQVVRRQAVIDSLVRKWDLDVHDTDLQEHYRAMAERTGMNIARIRALYDDEERQSSLKGQLLNEKVLDRLLELAVENQARAAATTPA